jgi:DNA end-binding protein Ku
MRSIWKGAISFGLVSIPVKLYTATEERDVSFHQVHRDDGGRIRYKRVCSVDGDEVAYADIAKGYELPGGEMVVLTDDDLADLPLSTSRVVDVLSFVPLDQVDPIYFAKSYYLEPDKAATKPYLLLRNALERSGMVALVKVAIRTKEVLATLRVRDGVLVLETMIWPDEVRAPDFPFLEEDVTVRPQELTMAESLIESMAGDFDPTQYHDEYREALQQVVEAKVEGREIVEPQPAAVAQGGAVVDLMAALRESVAAAKRSRGEEPALAAATDGATDGAGGGTDERPAAAPSARSRPAKKAAVKSAKAPAKKAAAKKAPAKAPAKVAAKTAPSRDGAAAKAVGSTGVGSKAPAKKAAKKTASRRTA